MEVVVNGKRVSVTEGSNLLDLLRVRGLIRPLSWPR